MKTFTVLVGSVSVSTFLAFKVKKTKTKIKKAS